MNSPIALHADADVYFNEHHNTPRSICERSDWSLVWSHVKFTRSEIKSSSSNSLLCMSALSVEIIDASFFLTYECSI